MHMIQKKLHSDDSQITALIVNDNLFQRKFMRFQLEKEGFRIIEACDGQSTLEKLEEETKPSVIIADIDMPRVNGWELLKQIRKSKNPEIQNIPVIIVSAFYSAAEAKLLGGVLGANATISIPYKIETLLKKVQTCLKKQYPTSKGTVLLEITREELPAWEKAFRMSGFRLLSKEKPFTAPTAVIVESDLPTEIIKIRQKWPDALIIVLNMKSTLSPMDFLATGASFVFSKTIDPSYVCLLVVREIERNATEMAYKILKERTADIDRYGIEERFRKGVLSKLFFNLDSIGLVVLDEVLESLFITPTARILCAEAGKLDNESMVKFLKKHIVDTDSDDNSWIVQVNIGTWNIVRTVELMVVRSKLGSSGIFLIFVRDISSHIRDMDELFQTTKMNSILIMAGGIAHDLNNILMSLSGYAQLIEERIRRQGREDGSLIYLDNINVAVKKAAHIVAQLTRFSTPKPPATATLELNSLISNLIDFMKNSLSNVDIVLLTHKDKLLVRADESDLENVFSNLVINAANATRYSGHIEISTGSLLVQEQIVKSGAAGFVFSGFSPRNGLHAFVSIKDSGLGIKKDVLPNIFEPYFTTRLDEGGSGLGLTMCYSVIKSLNGFISVETFPGKGTVFTVYLPLIKSDDSNTSSDKNRGGVSSDIKGLKCLIVDDEPSIRNLVSNFVIMKGAYAVTASDGGEAIHILKSEDNFDVIILDINMPKMNGVEFLERKQAMHNSTPVIMATGRVETELIQKCKALGTFCVLQKPYRLQKLLSVLTKIKQESKIKQNSS